MHSDPLQGVNMTCEFRADPQPGDEIRVGGQIRQIIRRDGDDLWCQDGAVRYKTTVHRWREWVLINAGMTRYYR